MKLRPIYTLMTALLCVMGLQSALSQAADGRVLPPPSAPFEGQLNPTENTSDRYLPPSPLQAPTNAPNVLLIMTDDVGFGAVSPFGGPVPKPALEKLAKQGLRFNQFHTTGVCGPTRAALLTGRNHHSVGTGHLSEMASSYPGYTGSLPPTAATVARVLRDNGYSTAMFGKDHNVPMAYRTPAGPFDQWPTGRGFEYFYGWISGDTDQFDPVLYEGTNPVDASHRADDYLFDRDMVDKTIEWIHTQKAAAPDKPFFIYQALGTAHAPQQAPAEWIAKFRGRFDHGWDEERKRILQRQKNLGIVPQSTQLAPRPKDIPAWSSLSTTEKKVFARFMEVYAAMLAYQDAQIGRLMNELERMGLTDNTLVIYIEGDNGSAAETGIYGSVNELPDITAPKMGLNYDMDWLADNLDVIGGPQSYAAIPVGWAVAMNTPMPWTKQVASHLGATRNGMVVSWPHEIKQGGELRNQFHHVIDVMPTILQATGIQAPDVVDGIEQQPIEGTSMVYAFNQADAPDRHTTQYFELFGNRAIYHNGWWANTTPRDMPWNISRAGAGSDVTSYPWELYNLKEDFSQSHNLAEDQPERLQTLQKVFDTEARKYQVYPLQNTGARQRAAARGNKTPPRTEFIYWGSDIQIPHGDGSPAIFWVPFSVEAEIEISEDGAEGVIFAAGSYFGGWSFYLNDGHPVVAASRSPLPGGFSRVAADEPLAAGKHTLLFDVSWSGQGADVIIREGDRELAHGTIENRPLTNAGGGEFFETGKDSHVPVSSDYQDDGRFTGRIDKVTVKLKLKH